MSATRRAAARRDTHPEMIARSQLLNRISAMPVRDVRRVLSMLARQNPDAVLLAIGATTALKPQQ